MTMVERMARALAAANGDEWSLLARNKAHRSQMWVEGTRKAYTYTRASGQHGFFQDDYLDMARAALDAMKEPSEGMMFAGGTKHKNLDLAKPPAFYARQIYWSMIAAALKEGETT